MIKIRLRFFKVSGKWNFDHEEIVSKAQSTDLYNLIRQRYPNYDGHIEVGIVEEGGHVYPVRLLTKEMLQWN